MERSKVTSGMGYRMSFVLLGVGKVDDAKMKTGCGSETGVFKGDFGRCPRCSWMLRYAFFLIPFYQIDCVRLDASSYFESIDSDRG